MGIRGNYDDPITLACKGLREVLREDLNPSGARIIERREDAYAGSFVQDLPLQACERPEQACFGLEL